MSDHRPVALTLASTEGGTPSPHGKRVPRFDVRKWQHYGVLFEHEDRAPLSLIDATMNRLGADLGSTQAVESMAGALLSALKRAFNPCRKPRRNVREEKDAVWWTDECSAAREAMMTQKTLMLNTGRLEDVNAKRAFSSLRTRYQRLISEAKEAFQNAYFFDFLADCKADPRMLWRKLNAGKTAPCPISDVHSWKDYFDALYNNETNAFNDVHAESILAFINGQPRVSGKDWEQSNGERAARVTAAAALNVPFTAAEVVKAVNALGNH